jgi:hypothetical protein
MSKVMAPTSSFSKRRPAQLHEAEEAWRPAPLAGQLPVEQHPMGGAAI